MQEKTSKSSSQLGDEFRRLTSSQELVGLLGLTLHQLHYLIFWLHPSKRYIHFQIRMRSGDIREIKAPTYRLKLIQKRLGNILQAVYTPKPSTHGFVVARNILSNASEHVKKRFVLNIDLKDFFPTINFGRVYGMFLKPPFSFSPQVARDLSQICCHENQLPQGAPTSPIISNMICSRLDSRLQRLASIYRCSYSRYADDITFSSTSKIFPRTIASSKESSIGAEVILGRELHQIIREEGFEINEKKSKLFRRNKRHEVTGIITNDFPNLPKKFHSQLRAMLHAWDKFGYSAADHEFQLKYNSRKHRPPFKKPPTFRQVLLGKLYFFKMVVGEENRRYVRFANQLAALDTEFDRVWKRKKNERENLSGSIWVLECQKSFRQGTAFHVDNYGWVTCAHVLGPETYAFHADDFGRKFPVRVVAKNEVLDLALIEFGAASESPLRAGNPTSLDVGDKVKVAGYPNYSYGQSLHSYTGEVAGFRPQRGIRRIQISAPIIKGNSGGPVFDRLDQVIGIAVTGADREIQDNENSVIPINALDSLVK